MKSSEFQHSIRDALEHLYDTAYLEVHPLLTHIAGVTTTHRSTRAQELRSLLKESIEALRPPQGKPSRSPEWRSYLALRYRYVQGMVLGQVESELSLSRRQLQREIQKGLEALASIVWARHGLETEAAPPAESASAVPAPDLENELKQWELSRQACDVHTLVNDTLSLLKAAREEGQADVHVDLPNSLALVYVDTTLSRQALLMTMRLLIQHTRSAISLTAVQQEKFIEIQLLCKSADAACPADDAWEAPRLLIQRQGGSLSVESGENKDWKVNIRLPMADQTRVLVIDDNPAILQLFERYLTPRHFEVIMANGGEEVLELVIETRPAVIILDVMMPNLDGWQVLRSLKDNPATAATPIVICSVLKEPKLALSLGAHAYLKKPVERLTLLAQVEQLIKPGAPAEAMPPPEYPDI
jgi:CheY-like chemotaxis protein